MTKALSLLFRQFCVTCLILIYACNHPWLVMQATQAQEIDKTPKTEKTEASSLNNNANNQESKQEEQTSYVVTKLKALRDTTSDLTIGALSLIGVRYKMGGNTPENGLDCSGFVRYVFKQNQDTNLPRTAKAMSDEGKPIEDKELQPGDLVFFNTMKRSFSHVGIYLGDNKFIHSPSAGGHVRIESMTLDYWKKRFNGARRILTGASDEKNSSDTHSTKDKK